MAKKPQTPRELIVQALNKQVGLAMMNNLPNASLVIASIATLIENGQESLAVRKLSELANEAAILRQKA